MIEYSVLASGSTGNSIYIGSNKRKILIDAGISGKRIENALKEFNIDPRQLDGIYITHEHDDHVKGIGVLARKYNIPIFGNEKTINNLPKNIGNIDSSLFNIFVTGSVQEYEDYEIETFAISHDAAEPVGYIIRTNKSQLSIATDLGYVSKKIKDKIYGSNAFIFEANHDVEMLRVSSYPWHIKQRILSDIGHLSNETSGEALVDIISNDTKTIHLAHLSKENNLVELARLTVKNMLAEYGINEQDLIIKDTYPDKPTNLEKIIDKEYILG